ncbi:hypothetical protein KP79_PYT15460 [Mizuhopecten yessoensis]|uniref:Uncharacterized protein n=1 Tax=Mizuhopecten yessoensis TaxID=6573 RepID=A0A210QBX4_MIZYE|nr:hypothetical protein KP79_PYT15460 [Mizuhopecten yessoensis]
MVRKSTCPAPVSTSVRKAKWLPEMFPLGRPLAEAAFSVQKTMCSPPSATITIANSSPVVCTAATWTSLASISSVSPSVIAGAGAGSRRQREFRETGTQTEGLVRHHFRRRTKTTRDGSTTNEEVSEEEFWE